jgi:CheY-like chemotaxis protein
MDGWRVLERLKSSPATRHVPVHIITTEEERARGLRMGAVGVLTKPVQERALLDETLATLKRRIVPTRRSLLLLAEASGLRDTLTEIVTSPTVDVTVSASLDEATAAVRNGRYDLVVLAGEVGGQSEVELASRLAIEPSLSETPVLVYLRQNVSRRDDALLKRLVQMHVVKEVRSLERLLDEVVLFLHLKQDELPAAKQQTLQELRSSRAVLAGKKVLVVDDDVRNIFALGTVLEPHDMKIVSAENGKQAIEILQRERDFDAVLMDIMMPEMDGYDTMRAIRKVGRLRALPIIALTAKAMKGDREKCIEAGASDYVSKPVDTEQLLGVLRSWLYR